MSLKFLSATKKKRFWIYRIDSTKGYVLSNVRPCCKVCNRAKGTLSLKEFLNWIQDLKGSDL